MKTQTLAEFESLLKRNKKKNNKKKNNWKIKRRNEIILLLGGECKKCKYNKCLEIHHKFRKEKEKDWMKKGYDLKNLELLCSNCHTMETLKK